MRLNKYIAQATGMSRRAADEAITQNRIHVNGSLPTLGQQVHEGDTVTLDEAPVKPAATTVTIMFNKPVGYVCSRDGQGSRTIYDLLPAELHTLKTVGRLDKNSSGLLLLTNDGQLAQELTHPSFHKTKVYEVKLNGPLQPLHRQMISEYGVMLEDGISKFLVDRTTDNDLEWTITMHEGRNRQIRRTFDSLSYTVTALHRTKFGVHILDTALKPGEYTTITELKNK